MSRRNIIFSIVAALIVCTLVCWFLFFRGSSSPFPVQLGSFGTALNKAGVSNNLTTGGTPAQTSAQTAATGSTKIFNISNEPVTSATFIETTNPTTTVARFVTQEDGHVFDF